MMMMFCSEIALHCVRREHGRYGSQLHSRTLVANKLWALSKGGVAVPICLMNIARHN